MKDPDSRYTFYIPKEVRNADYYDKIVVSYGDVFLRKTDGTSFVLSDDSIFQELYNVFDFNLQNNNGLAAFVDDCIEFVEIQGGFVVDDKPDWFYEHITETVNFIDVDSCILIGEDKEFDVTEHCVFLQNRWGEIRSMRYADFFAFYDPDLYGSFVV